jgi:hypothetical protein
MFDTYNNKRTEYVPYAKSVKVTEHKAPTDESMRLLKEMEEEAISSVVASVKVDDNKVNFNCTLFSTPINLGYHIVCQVSINGEMHKIDRKVSHVFYKNKREIVDYIHKIVLEEVSKILSTKITIGLIEDHLFTKTSSFD